MSEPLLDNYDPSNLVNKVRDLENRIARLEQREVEVDQLSEISNDAGPFVGDHICPLDDEITDPTDPAFSGVVTMSDGIEVDGVTYLRAVIKLGVVQTGDTIDGKTTAGAGVIESDVNGQSILEEAAIPGEDWTPNTYAFRSAAGAIVGGMQQGYHAGSKWRQLNITAVNSEAGGTAIVGLSAIGPTGAGFVNVRNGNVEAGGETFKFNDSNVVTASSKASGAEINAGTDDAKFVTAKAIKDAGVYDVYTPVLVKRTNVAAVVAYATMYARFGPYVRVDGLMEIDPTSTGDTEVGIPLPIASNFNSAANCVGVAAAYAVAGLSAMIYADIDYDRARLRFTAVDANNRFWSFSFVYRVI